MTPGTRLGPYEVLSLLGAGGMGEVYRARDTRLGRDVAIKVLPAALSADADRLTRFEQEARATAALNHPNIIAVYDVGTHDDAPYIVSELLDGTTLRERLDHGTKRPSDGGSSGSGAATTDSGSRSGRGLSVQKAIDYAVQIASGLAAAHDKGIVHRDLKPDNVFVTADGHVKILDFGLAKLVEAQPALAGVTALATTPPGTQPGVMLGTVGYMAPEQVRGQAVDHRADIFAFGAILHEMLSGRRAFAGTSAADTISAILEHDPEELPATARTIPPALVRLVDRCLEKNPTARFQSTRDLTFALEALDSRFAASDVAVSRRGGIDRARLAWLLLAAASIVIAALAVPATLYFRRAAPERVVTRLDLVTPRANDPNSFALSPDGRRLVFVADADGVQRLHVRSLDDTTARPLAGSDDAQYPFWAPNSGSLGFFAGGKLKTIDVSGGAAQTIADAPAGRGGAWNDDDVILFAGNQNGGLATVAASGGAVTVVTRPAPGQVSHRFPEFLPDSRHFLFLVALGAVDQRGLYLGSLDGATPTRLLTADTAAAFVPPDRLLVMSQSVLTVRRFDPGQPASFGEPAVVADGFDVPVMVGQRPFSASKTGLLTYRLRAGGRRQLAWVDRTGKAIAEVGAPDGDGQSMPELARDDHAIAVVRAPQGNVDIWLRDSIRPILTRFTSDPSTDTNPVWSPHRDRIAFSSPRNGTRDIFEKPADGSPNEKVLLATSQDEVPLDWSSDGRFLLFAVQDLKNASDLWALPLFGDRKPFSVVQSGFDDVHGQFSRDGRWIAYASNESGRYEVYVTPFQGSGGRWQLSTSGGIYPRWRADGKELFYIAPDNRMMAVPIDVAGTTLRPGTPVSLFPTDLATGGNVGITGSGSHADYAVASDGRFLLNVRVGDNATSPITVMQNWDAAVKR